MKKKATLFLGLVIVSTASLLSACGPAVPVPGAYHYGNFSSWQDCFDFEIRTGGNAMRCSDYF